MASGVQFKIDAKEFTDTLNRYRTLSKRDPKTICDTKAFFIARRATLETMKASKQSITGDLGKIIRVKKEPVALRLKTVRRFTRWGLEYQAPLAALIINARRGRAGKPGLFGAAMTEAIHNMIAARLKSIAFIKSGWIPAIKTLMPFADKKGAPRQDKAEQLGRPRGYARPAASNWKASAVLVNTASTTRDQKQALLKYGGPGLQRAFDAETASMRQYMEDKLRGSAKAAGIKTN